MEKSQQQHTTTQLERERHAQAVIGTIHERFYPFGALECVPESPLTELGVFLAKKCPQPTFAISLETIHRETGAFYGSRFPRYVLLLRNLAEIIRKRLPLREPYAFVFAHLLLYSRISCNSPEVDRDAVFLCARQLRDLYTQFVRCLVDFDIYRGILTPKLRALLLLYLETLTTVYSGQLPIW